MSSKAEILNKYRAHVRERFDRPSLDDIKATSYPDSLEQFKTMTRTAGGNVVEMAPGEEVDTIVRRLFPEAVEIASNLPEVTIATRNPDTVPSAQALNGTDVGVIRGVLGVAENGCIWIPQTMKEKAVCFISENLVILLPRNRIVNNMHEAYRQVTFNDYGYGTFISGPSKTADIAQVLVMGAQAARSVTVVLEP